jgi:hypothetical protein
VTVAASVRYITASVMSLTVEGRTRDATLLRDERECRDRDRFQHDINDMQPAVRPDHVPERRKVIRSLKAPRKRTSTGRVLPAGSESIRLKVR